VDAPVLGVDRVDPSLLKIRVICFSTAGRLA